LKTGSKHPLLSRILHWLMAAIILAALGLGIYMVEFLDKEAANRQAIYDLHKSLGVVVFMLIILLRLPVRLVFGAPPLPKSLPIYERILARLTYLAFYFLMIAVPLSGYLMTNAFGYPVPFFSLTDELLFIYGIDDEMAKKFAEFHKTSAFVLLALVTLHILAVIKHRFFDKPENDLLKRMW